jgi:hypothetical protein
LNSVKDNKLVDFVAATLTGIALYWLQQMPLLNLVVPLTFFKILQSVLLKTIGFVFVALMLFLWKHKLRAQFGWIVIAVLGLTITAGIDEMILRADNPEPDFFAAFSPFPMEIFLFIIPALFFMGLAHYIGVSIVSLKGKNNPTNLS